MRRIALLALVLFCPAFACSLSAQVDASVCGILSNPQSFDGKLVRVKGTVIAGFEEFAIKGSDCHQPVNAIWLSYPEGTAGKAGPAAFLRLQLASNNRASVPSVTRTPVTLEKTKDFQDFDTFLSTPGKASDLCLGCVKFVVTATLVGRLDGINATGLVRDSAGKVIGLAGFGNLNRYNARLVLQSVSEVSPHEIDYTRAADAPTYDAASWKGAFVPGVPAGSQVKRGADAFGGPGEDNGVDMGFHNANEIPPDDGQKAKEKSPDGLIFRVIFDSDRLKGPALQIAISHVGTHIADIRSTMPDLANLIFYGAEFRAWQTAVLGALATGTRTLTLPGGYLIYSQYWPGADLGDYADGGIAGFLDSWAGITNPPTP